jgi:hypothetical protein
MQLTQNTILVTGLGRRRAEALVRKRDGRVLQVLGASIQFLVGPDQDEAAPCILKRTIPPGVSVLMHSHDVVESFLRSFGEFRNTNRRCRQNALDRS